MRDEYKKLARNYFLLGLWGEKKGMTTEPVANYFKTLFAITDGIL